MLVLQCKCQGGILYHLTEYYALKITTFFVWMFQKLLQWLIFYVKEKVDVKKSYKSFFIVFNQVNK